MAEPVKCAACGRAFNPAFTRCPFCNAPARPSAAPTRIDYSAVAEQAIARHRPFLALEFHPAAVAALDAFFDLTWGSEGLAPGDDAWKPTAGQASAIIGLGAFLGEVLRRELGGAWKEDPGQPDNPHLARVVLRGGAEVFAMSRVYKRLKSGRDESLEALYQLARKAAGGRATPAEIPGWLRQAKHFEDVGRPDLAAAFYGRALVLGPAPAQRTEIERLLAVAAGPSPAPRKPDVVPPVPVQDPAARLAEIERIEDVGQAVEAYARFNAEYPDFAEPWRERGVGLVMLGRGEEALPCFDRAAELEPGEPKSYDHKAVALARLERHEDAVRTLDEGLRHCPGAGVLLSRRGVFLVTLGRTEEAMRSFEEALRTDPEYPETWAFKGDLEQRLGRTADAIASLRRYLIAKGESQEKRVLVVRRQLAALEQPGA